MAIRGKLQDDAQKSIAADAILAKDQSSNIDSAQIVRKEAYPNAPTSIRLSIPLLERLDHMASEQDRTRGNLIQHILWEYVRKHTK